RVRPQRDAELPPVVRFVRRPREVEAVEPALHHEVEAPEVEPRPAVAVLAAVVLRVAEDEKLGVDPRGAEIRGNGRQQLVLRRGGAELSGEPLATVIDEDAVRPLAP